jgi:hypothetical protein
VNRAPRRLIAVVFLIVIAVGTRPAAQAPTTPASSPDAIVGAWTLNKDLSDKAPERSDGSRSGRDGGGRGGRGGGRGGGGRFGGGGVGRNGGGLAGARGAGDDEDRRRQMTATREIMEAPDRLTITRADAMVIITGGDGRTTRLLTDGKAVKDDSTKIERKTRWSGDKLVSEISGIGRGKITETYMSDLEQHRLTVTLVMEKARTQEGQARTVTRVYDAEPR